MKLHSHGIYDVCIVFIRTGELHLYYLFYLLAVLYIALTHLIYFKLILFIIKISYHSVIPWMMLNDDCPMCRTRLIDDDGKSRTLSEEFFDDDDEEDDQMQRFQIVNGLIRFIRGNSPGSPLRTGSSNSLELQEMDSTGHSSSIDAEQKSKPVSNKTRRKKNKKYASLASGDEDEVVEMSTLDTSISNDNDEDDNDNSNRLDSIV